MDEVIEEMVPLQGLGHVYKEMSSDTNTPNIAPENKTDMDTATCSLSKEVQEAIEGCADNVCDVVREWLTSNPQCVNDTNQEGKTALHIAASKCNSQAVDILLKAGAYPNKTDGNGHTVLHCLCKVRGNSNITDCAEMLLSKITDVNAKDNDLHTSLHYAATNGRLEVVIKLLDMGADMSICDSRDDSAAHKAAESGHTEVLAELVRRKPDCVLYRGWNNETILHRAVDSGSVEAVEIILEAGSKPEVSAMSSSNITPFHKASLQGKVDIAELLLRRGATVDGIAFRDILYSGYEDIAKAVMESGQWRSALHGTYEYRKKQTTAFRELIVKMPEVAKIALDNCVVNGPYKDEPLKATYGVAYDYELIDDFQDDREDAQGSRFKDYGFRLVTDPKRKQTGPEKFRKGNHPLTIMVQEKQKILLYHPVVLSLIDYKWKTYGRLIYVLNLIVYSLFLIFLTSFALVIKNPQLVDCPAVNTTICNATSMSQRVYPGIAAVIVIISALFRLVFELGQLVVQRLYYFTDWINWMEIILFPCSIIFVAMPNWSCPCVLNWQWQVGIVAVFLGWINFILFTSQFPFVGIYVIMFVQIFRTFIKLVLLMVLLVITFGITFFMIFSDPRVKRSPFSIEILSMVKTLMMTTGEIDYNDNFRLDPSDADNQARELPFLPVAYIVWILFVILMPVLFANMLTGLAVGDTNTVLKEAEFRQLALTVHHVLSLDAILPRSLRRWLRKRNISTEWNRIYPNKKKTKLQEWASRAKSFFDEDEHQYDTLEAINMVKRPHKETTEVILDSSAALAEELRDMKQALQSGVQSGVNKELQDIKSRLDRQEKLLLEIGKKCGIESEGEPQS